MNKKFFAYIEYDKENKVYVGYIPSVNGAHTQADTLEELLLMLGFVKMIQKGSHAFYKHIDGRSTVIPFHSNKNIARPLLRKILNEVG